MGYNNKKDLGAAVMDEKRFSEKDMKDFQWYLLQEEKSPATIEKYLRDVRFFMRYVQKEQLSKEIVIAYKKYLQEQQYAVRSINSMLASVNSFLHFCGCPEYRVKAMKLQKQVYCSEEKELTKTEYYRLVRASAHDQQLQLVMQSICSTGIRVSELQFFTVEQIRRGEIVVACKGKNRTILLPKKLQTELLAYARKKKIVSGMIFLNSNGTYLNRKQIWAKMKQLCKKAQVNPKKVFPHNLRKLFARVFYSIDKDIAKLADMLGHSSIDTTRIYIMTTGIEHRRQLEQLKLLI